MVNAYNESACSTAGRLVINPHYLLHLFFKLHFYNYTLPPLIKQRNWGVVFYISCRPFSPLFLGKILGPGINKSGILELAGTSVFQSHKPGVSNNKL